MLSRLQQFSRRAQGKKNRRIEGAVRPVLQSLESRRMLSAGTPDLAFGDNGHVVETFNPGSTAIGTAIQHDASTNTDSILVLSTNLGVSYVSRYSLNGTPDTAFGNGGYITLDYSAEGDDTAAELLVRPNGNIIVAGTTSGDGADVFVAEFDQSGTPVSSFGDNGVAIDTRSGDQSAVGAVLANDGAVFVAGNAGGGFIEKFNASGIDSSFGDQLGQQGYTFNVAAVAIQSSSLPGDQRILLALPTDQFASIAGVKSVDGSIDSDYGVGGVAVSGSSAFVIHLTVDDSNNAIATGFVTNDNTDLAVLRFTPGGAPDAGFGVGGLATVSGDNLGDQYQGLGAKADSTGRIVATGLYIDNNTGNGYLVAVRFLTNGDLDPSFGNIPTKPGVTRIDPGITTFDQGTRVAFQPDGRIVVVGSAGADSLVLSLTGDPAAPSTPVHLDINGNLVVPATSSDDVFVVTSQIDGIHVNYNGVDSGAFNPSGHIIVNGGLGNDSITIDSSVTIATVINAGAGNDTVSGGSGADSVVGGDGDDQISGNAGNDTLKGGNGADKLNGGADNDLLNGNAGADSLIGDTGDDVINGGTDNDTSLGGDGNDSINNDGGDDQLFGGIGNDTLRCGDGNDSAYGEAGDDSLIGGIGDDLLDGGENNDTLSGGAGNDILIGDAGNDSINGADGADSIDAGDGDNSVNGGADNDTIVSGNGSDTLTGGAGDDFISSGAGADSLTGSGGNDILVGGADADTLSGGDGRDILIGGTGADSIVGNADEDILIAGTTSHDSSISELVSIQSEWTSAHTFAERTANIRTGTGPARSNGSNFFNPDGPIVTVFDDGAADRLTGSAGSDWFFFNNDGAVNDVITDLKAGEVSNDID